jgi:hypothetical protein
VSLFALGELPLADEDDLELFNLFAVWLVLSDFED